MSGKVDIIFTGLVRAPERFKKSVSDFVSMRKNGFVNQIIFSTWDYEVNKHQDIFDFLKKQKVKVIASKEPADRGFGNIWCQMKSLEVALTKVDDGRFVLKTRTDIYINPDFLRELFIKKESLLKITVYLPKGNIFKNKIWVHYYELKTPFHMGEECLFGEKGDLKLLVNYDKSYDTDYKVGDAVSHIRRFIHPFLKDYPIFYKYLGKYSKDTLLKTLAIKIAHKFKFMDIRGWGISRKISARNKLNNLENKLRDDNFIEILAAYYSILYSHFYIDGNSFDNQIVGGAWSTPGGDVNPDEFFPNFSVERSHPVNLGQIYVYDLKLLDNIFKGNIKQDQFFDKLKNAIKRFNSQ